MPLTTAVVFLCSNCKKEYFWQPELARRVAQCACGEVIQFPADDPSRVVASPSVYLPTVIDEKEALRRAKAAMKDDAVGITAQMQAAASAALNGDEPQLPLDPMRDVNVPFAVLAVGLLLIGFVAADVADKLGWFRSFITVVVIGAIELGLALMGLMLAGKLMNIDFGRKRIAAFKLSALFIAPNSVWLIMPMIMGADDGVTKVVGAFICGFLYWGLFLYLFRLGVLHVLCCIVCITVVKFIAAFALAFLAAMIFVASR